MPVKTRTQDGTRGTTHSSAPASRVYRSTRPSQQVQFPGRRKVVKRYGRRGAARSPKQRTLTQIGYVVPPPPDLYETDLWEAEDVESVDGDEMSTAAEARNSGHGKERGSGTGRRAGSRDNKHGEKRQRGLRTSLPSSSFQTQTLTQFVPAESSLRGMQDDGDDDGDDDDDDRTIQDSQNDDDDDDNVPGSPQMVYYMAAESEERDGAVAETSDPPTVIPQTPSKQTTLDETRRPRRSTTTPKTFRTEIPSSQPSPFTPVLLLERYHSPLGRQRTSPLQAKAAGRAGKAGRADQAGQEPEEVEDIGSLRDLSDRPSDRPGRTTLASQKRKRGSSQIVPDSYTTAESLSPVINSTATTASTASTAKTTAGLGRGGVVKGRSPLRPLGSSEILSRSGRQKAARGGTQEVESDCQDENTPVEGDGGKPKPSRANSPTPSGKRRRSDGPASHEEIPDSDDSDEEEMPPLALDPISSETGASVEETRDMAADKVDDEVEDAEDDDIGVGNMSAGGVEDIDSSSLSELDSGTPTPLPGRRVQSASSRAEQVTPPTRTQEGVAGSEGAGGEVHDYASQALESQRVPLEVIRTLGPQTDRSDIIVSIHPEQVKKIVDGSKDHEFRSYKIPQTVTRFWIYVTRPVCELQYMAVVCPGFRQPGEIDSASGVGNADFNAGRMYAKFAYKLMQVYQLNNPVSLEMMKRNGWVDGAPQRYTYVPPAVVGSLLANLRCALFAEEEQSRGGQGDGDTLAELTISQEVEAQLLSDMSETQHHHTPPPPSSQAAPEGPQGSAKPVSVRFDLAAANAGDESSGKAAALFPGGPPAAQGMIRASQATTASCPSIQDISSDGPGEVTVAGEENDGTERMERTDGIDENGGIEKKDGGNDDDDKDDSDCETRPHLPVPDSQLSLPSPKTRWWRRSSRQRQQQQPQHPPQKGGQQRRQQQQPRGQRRLSQAIPSSSTDSTQIVLPDSLYEEVRQAPPAVILDSEDSDEEI